VRYLGLDPDKDVKIIDTGESLFRVAALKDGSIDATTVDVALAVKMEEAGMKRLLHLGDIIDIPTTAIAVTAAKLATHREQIKKVIQTTLRGARFIKQKKTETIRIIQRQLPGNPSASPRAGSGSPPLSKLSLFPLRFFLLPTTAFFPREPSH